uniref:(northern house mosquito) hypothetical protein n=1 Tax=Culex pipiens TaxID=7175 RepID=A0A8D8F9J2_CULPI
MVSFLWRRCSAERSGTWNGLGTVVTPDGRSNLEAAATTVALSSSRFLSVSSKLASSVSVDMVAFSFLLRVELVSIHCASSQRFDVLYVDLVLFYFPSLGPLVSRSKSCEPSS